jgi:hypothetical protein
MRNFVPALFATLCLALAVTPAFAQDGSYQNYLVPVPTAEELNCAAQPTNQYYNPAQQQPQFNQMVSQAQVPWGSPGQAFDQSGMQQQQFVSQTQVPQAMTPYQQQEAAIAQAQMAQQLDDRKQVDEAFQMSSQFNEKKKDSNWDHNKPSKGKAVANGLGRLVKGSMRYAVPAAGTVGSVYLLRAAFGGNGMMMMPMGGGMMVVPGR